MLFQVVFNITHRVVILLVLFIQKAVFVSRNVFVMILNYCGIDRIYEKMANKCLTSDVGFKCFKLSTYIYTLQI